MVPWSHLRQPSSGWVLTDLNSEFTHFNLVIRLSQVQQLALRFISLFECPAAPIVPGTPVLRSVKGSLSECSETSVFCSNVCSASASCHDIWIRQAHVLQVWYSSFWWLSGEVQHIVHLIRWKLESCFMPIGARLDHGPGEGNNRTTFRHLGTESWF